MPVNVRVNVINEMKKLRESAYSDRYAWVDEVVQNCQRAGATHIDVTIEDDQIIISDNGKGCTDPQVLFDKSSSGWDSDIMAAENPFGEGFFSTMMAADTITVKSVGFNAVFDVKKMFETNSTEVIDVTPNRRQSGFTLILSDLRPNVSIYSVRKRFDDTCKYIKCPSTTINGDRVNYEGLSPKEDHPFMHKINTPLFKGWIVPDCYRDTTYHRYYNDIEVQCFAFSRLIKKSTKFSGIRGIINFNENAITLRSPDRKEFVEDEKYEACIEAFNAEIKKMFINLLKYGDDETIHAYEDYITKYINLDEYRRHVRFKLLSVDKDKPLDDIKIETEMITDDGTSDTFDTDIDDSDIADITSATTVPQIEFDVTTQITGRHKIAAQTSVATPKKAPARRRVSQQTGNDIDSLAYGFYVRESETTEFENEIHIAQYYDIPVIVLRNAMEREIVMVDDRFNHLSEMRDMITLNAEYRNTDPQTQQETRATKLLSRLARAMHIDEHMFIIADTKFQKVLQMSNGCEHAIEDIDVIATAYDGHIYINRKFMTAYTDLTDTSDALTPADIKFLLINGQTFAHEMAHVIYKTIDNTQEHAEKTLLLLDKIIKIIYGKKFAA